MFIIEKENSKFEVYLTDKGEVFFGDNDDAYGSFFTITKEEWEMLKTFIDGQYENLQE